MDIAPTYATTAPQTQTQTPTRTGTATGSDYETFLKMLTTQLKNQDPLNPIESTDYAVQLATFSGVEQQVRTNQLLEGLGGQLGLLGMSALANWVGQEARTAAPVYFDGTSPVSLSPNPAVGADKAVLAVYDAQGTLVAREDMPVSTQPYQWFGADAEGNPLPAGRYTLQLESSAGETVLATTPMESYTRILEARGGPGGTTLILNGGVEVSAGAITALRLP